MTKKQPRPLTWRAAQVGQADAGPGGRVVEWPRPVQDGEWVDAEGISWRMRGSRLAAKQARPLMSRPEVTVVWAYVAHVLDRPEPILRQCCLLLAHLPGRTDPDGVRLAQLGP